MTAVIWWLYSDSERTRPAMNAPRASDRPSSDVSHEVPRLTPEADEDHEDDEDFGAAQPDYVIKRARHQYPRGEDYRRDGPGSRAERQEYLRGGRSFLAPEHGDQQHHQDDAEVLKQQNADGRPRVRRVDLAPVHVALEHDGRA
jgi:hypothetical protein